MNRTFYLPRDVCLLIGIFFTTLSAVSGIAVLGVVIAALCYDGPPPVPGLWAFLLNSLSVGGCGVSAWWWFREWWGC